MTELLTGDSGRHYEIGARIGLGASSEVFVATPSDGLSNRSVALKLFHQQLSPGSKEYERFRREVTITERLRCESVPRCLDSGRSSTGHPFIVYELVDGRSLEEIVAKSGPLQERAALWIGERLATALVEASHLHPPVIHRDIKPSNVLLDEDGRAFLVDWGIAAAVQDWNPTAALGTPLFAAPEQFANTGLALDQRVDQFGLGATLLFAITGEPPRTQGGTGVVTLPLDVVKRISAGVQQLLARCLAQRPGDRFDDPAQLLDWITRLRSDPSYRPLPQPPSPTGPTVPLMSRTAAAGGRGAAIESSTRSSGGNASQQNTRGWSLFLSTGLIALVLGAVGVFIALNRDGTSRSPDGGVAPYQATSTSLPTLQPSPTVTKVVGQSGSNSNKGEDSGSIPTALVVTIVLASVACFVGIYALTQDVIIALAWGAGVSVLGGFIWGAFLV